MRAELAIKARSDFNPLFSLGRLGSRLVRGGHGAFEWHQRIPREPSRIPLERYYRRACRGRAADAAAKRPTPTNAPSDAAAADDAPSSASAAHVTTTPASADRSLPCTDASDGTLGGAGAQAATDGDRVASPTDGAAPVRGSPHGVAVQEAGRYDPRARRRAPPPSPPLRTRPDPPRPPSSTPCPILGGLAGCPTGTLALPRSLTPPYPSPSPSPSPPPPPRPLAFAPTLALAPSPPLLLTSLPLPLPLTLTLSLAGSGAGRARLAEEAHAQPDQPAAHLTHQRADQRARRQSAAAARAKPRAPARDQGWALQGGSAARCAPHAPG